MKTLDTLKKIATAGMVLSVTTAATIVGAEAPNDFTVVIRSVQTVKQAVNAELQSDQFADQIASYNGIASAGTVLAVGTTLAIPRPYMRSIDYGRIAFVKGDVVHTQSELVVNPPAKGSFVRNGDEFRTGANGFVSLTFNSGARVNLQPDSRVLINDIDCAEASVKCVIAVSATEGQVHSEIAPRPEEQPPVSFTVDTPFLTAAVRGTAFYVDLNNKENRIGVTKGLVATDSSGVGIDLPRGKGLSAKPGVAPKVVDLLNPPSLNIQADSILVSAEDRVSWSNLDGATSYLANIAVDSAMAEPVIVQRTENTAFTPELTPGDYYLTVAGVDHSGFTGLSARQQLTYAEITDPQQPRVEILRSGRTVEVSIPGQQGPAQLLIGKSIESENFEYRLLDNAADKVLIELPENEEWVFRARRILGPYEVSAYSNYYVLRATTE